LNLPSPATPREAFASRNTITIAAALLALLLLTVAVFRPAINGPFVFDDFPNLQNLSQLEGRLDRAHIGQYLAAFNGNPGRPLAALSFVIEDSAWPTDPFPFKRDNLLWHLLAGVLVFAMCRRLARLLSSTAPHADVIALTTMAMWLLHPIQLSATMLVVQRMNILGTIFILLGLLGYLKCLRSQAWPPFCRVAGAGASLAVSAALAILCKENGILVFAYAVVLNLTLQRGEVAALAPPFRRLLQWGAGLPMLLLAALAIATFPQIEASYRAREFTLFERLLTQPRILFAYLREILLPRIGTQGIFHDGYVVSHGWLAPPATAVAALLLFAFLATAWRLRSRWPLFAFAVFWFLAGHLIESTIWPLELYFEHRNYLPMMGPLFATAASMAALRPTSRRAGWILLGCWLAMVTGLTAVNARTWGDRGTLASVWFQENPQSPRAVQMIASYQADMGDLKAARRTFQAGLARMPEAGEFAMQLTLLDCVTVGITRAQWNELLVVASHVRYSAIVPDLVSRFGQQSRAGKCHGTMLDGDFIRLSEVFMRNPAIAWRKDTLGYIYYEMSRQAAYDRDLQKTMDYLDASYANHPNPLVPRNQAIYLLTAGLPDDAMRYLRKSETTPQPWLKRKLLNIDAMNVPLWRSARIMKKTLRVRERH
jgi:hypothetical protein